MRIHKDRVKYIFAVLTYLSCYIIMYKNIAVTKFSYFGFGKGEFESFLVFLIVFCALLPALFMPLGSKRPSVYINNILFFMIYIPILVIINDGGIQYKIENELFSIVILICFCILIISSRCPRLDLPQIKVLTPFLQPRRVIYFIALPFVIIIFYKVSSNFSIIGILDVYDKRDAVKELNLGIVGYMIAWLTNFILPVIIARGIILKQKKVIFLGILSYIFLFFTLGAKLYLLSMTYFMLSYGYLKSIDKSNVFIPLLFSALLIFPFLLVGDQLSGLRFIYEGLINMRVFLIQGLSAPVYVDFFSSHSYTHFSHISIISSFVKYPYSIGLPQLMEQQYALGNYNAPFFVSDGYASYGFLGMLIISCIVGAFNYLLDSVCSRHNFKYVIMALSVFVVSLSNVSFATALVTFGGAFFLIYFAFAREKKINERI